MKAAGLLLLFLRWLPGSTPTYVNDIAPIVQQNCIPCHRPGGGGPFPLLTYEDVRKHASQIAAVTERRYMPPWLPDSPSGAFLDERRLTSAQIQVIADWAAAKAPEGDRSQTTPLSATTASAVGEWRLGKPDLILKASKPLQLPAEGQDIFWNFLFSTNLQTARYVRAVEIHPGQDRLVHHANLIIDRAGSTRNLEKTPGDGFAGMDLNISHNPLDPESHFLFWKPGSQPYSEAEGFSWQLNPGNILVLNTHLQSSGKPEEIAPSIGIYFTDQPPVHYPILVELQDDRALNIPAGARDFTVEDHLTIPVNSRLLAIYPHAHYLGTLLEGFATLPDGSRQELIRIPHWDLNQQAVYRYREPIWLPKGTIVKMRYHYDNASSNIRNPNVPPKRVRAGNAATDEMGHLWLQLLPEGKGNRSRPIQEAVIRHRMEQEPADPTWHLNLAALQLSRLDAQSAIAELRIAVRLDPKRPEAHDMLGEALQNTGQLEPAIEQFREALEVQPSFLNARYNLALALAKTGDLQAALKHLQIVAQAYPESSRLQSEYQALRSRTESSAGHSTR